MAATGITHRWLSPPRQRIPIDGSLSLHSFACAADESQPWRPTAPGIDHVDFIVQPLGGIAFNGSSGSTTLQVTQLTPILSDRYFHVAYTVTLQASQFSAAGSFTVQAVAYSENGSIRGESILTFFIDKTTSGRQKRSCYIDNTVAGGDSSGVIDDPTRPFQTLMGARARCKTAGQLANPNDFGGVRFRFKSGQVHDVSHSGAADYPSLGEWVVFESWDGNESNTELRRVGTGNPTFSSSYGQFQHLRIKSAANNKPVMNNGTIWVDQCDCEGWKQFANTAEMPYTSFLPSPIGGNISGGFYMTNSRHRVGKFAKPLNGVRFFLGCEIQNFSEDCVQNDPVIWGCRIDAIDPGAAGVGYESHADVIQMGVTPGLHNHLYGFTKATNCHYQGFFLRNQGGASAPDGSEDWAFVNFIMEMRDPVYTYPGGGNNGGLIRFGGGWNQLKMWHCTLTMLLNTTGGATTRRVLFNADDAGFFSQKNCSIVGNFIEAYITSQAAWDQAGNGLGNRIRHNHYKQASGTMTAGTVTAPDTVGGTTTSGAAYIFASTQYDVIDYNVASLNHLRPPTVQSPVVRASFVPMIAWDVDGNVRSPTGATIGAYEFVAVPTAPATDDNEVVSIPFRHRRKIRELQLQGSI